MKKILIFLMAMAAGFAAVAQSAVVSAGGDIVGSQGTISFSVGQVVYQNVKNEEGSLAEGVQQPYEISVVGIDERPEITLNATIFPNPTLNSVMLKIETDTEETVINFEALLLNMNGQLLKSIKITELQTFVDMETLSEGVYFLRIISQNQSLKTFKIIKS